MIFKIGTADFSNYVANIKISKNTITSDLSGRNAAGTMVIDVIADKWKVEVNFKPLTPAQVAAFCNAILGYANLSVTFMNPFSNTTTQMVCYTGTPGIEYYRFSNNLKLTKPFTLSFIEM